MTSSSVTAIVYYNGTITKTQHGPTLASSEPMIVQLNNMSLDALKQVIENKISLPYGKVVKHIHYQYLISFVGDCF